MFVKVPTLVKLVYAFCLILKKVFATAILFVLLIILFSLAVILVSKLAMVEELTPPTLFTVVEMLPVPVPVASPVKDIV